jgi:opacity protein-like surface antigen
MNAAIRLTGKTMKKIMLAGFVAALSLATPALAADGAGLFNWSGFYVGGTAGGLLVRDDHIGVPPFFAGGNNSLSGALGGPTLGYNAQFGSSVVAGIEGDYSWSSVKDEISVACIPDCHERIPYFATVRARLGYAAGGYLAYVTGGGAFTRFKDTQAGVVNLGSKNVTGWTVGAGLESMIAGGWSWKAEYLFADFGHPEAINIGGGRERHDLSEHIFRVGINYRFGNSFGAMTRQSDSRGWQ